VQKKGGRKKALKRKKNARKGFSEKKSHTLLPRVSEWGIWESTILGVSGDATSVGVV